MLSPYLQERMEGRLEAGNLGVHGSGLEEGGETTAEYAKPEYTGTGHLR